MWKIKTKDGKEASELNAKWCDIQDNIEEMMFVSNNNQAIYLPKKMDKYIHFKTGSIEIGKQTAVIESRTVGFKIGENVVKIKVDEKTNNIKLEVE